MAETPGPGDVVYLTTRLIDALTSGDVSPEEAIVTIKQYDFFRHQLTEALPNLVKVFDSPEEFTKALIALLETSRKQLALRIPQLRTQPPDQALSPAEIASRGQVLVGANQFLRTAIGSQQDRLSSLRREFVGKLVGNWIEQNRLHLSGDELRIGATTIETTVSRGLAMGMDPERAAQQVKTQEGLPPDIAQTIQAALQEAKTIGLQLTKQQLLTERTNAAPKALLEHAGTKHPDWLASLLVTQLTTTAVPLDHVERSAVALVRTAEALSVSPEVALANSRSSIFFGAFADTGVQKALAGVADGVFLLLGPATKDRILEVVVAKTAGRVLSDVDGLTSRFGRSVVDSELFAQTKEALQKSVVAPSQGGSAAAKTRSLFEDLVGTILGSPAAEQVLGSPREAIFNYLNLAQMNASLPSQHRIWPDNVSPAGPITWQHLYLAALYSMGPERGLFAEVPSGAGQGGSPLGSVGASGVGGLLLGLGAALGSIVSAPLSWMSGGRNGGIFGLVERGIDGLFSGPLLGAWLVGARQRARRRTPLTQDLPLFVAVVVIVSLVLLFVLPTFLNSSFVNHISKTSALLCSQFIGNGACGSEFEGAVPALCNPATDPNCAAAFCDPSKQSCKWPIEGRGCITQGPGGTFSHQNLNAIDIVAPRGTPVYATHAGRVMGCNGDGGLYNTSFTPGEFKTKSYGNVVEIEGTDGTNTYQTIYGHLEKVMVTPCQEIQAGQQIGTIDDTGFSTQDHLHYEYRGGGSVWSILPRGLAVNVCYGGNP